MDEIVATASDATVEQGEELHGSAFFYNASVPVTPDLVEYRVDCLTNGVEVRDWTPAVPGESTSVLLEDEDTELIDDSNVSETKQITFRATLGATTLEATATYQILALLVVDDQKTINLICLMRDAVERRAPMPSSRISRFVDFDTGYP